MATKAKPYKDGSIRLGALNFHYLDWGNPRGQDMLLLHGGGQTAHSWDEFSEAMRTRYHVVALDQRGHGDSDWSKRKTYTLKAQLADINRLVDALKLKKIFLIGLSMGGRNSIGYAATHPEKIDRLVIVDIGPETNPEGGRARQAFVRADIQPSFETFVQRAHKFNPRRPLKQLRDHLHWNLRQLPNGTWTWKYDLHGRNAGDPNAPRVDLWSYVRRIKAPTLIVRGAESDTLRPAVAEKMQKTIPNCEYTVVPKAGHTVPGDNPPGFLKAVNAFVPGK